MLISVKTANGHAINDGTNYEAYGPAFHNLPSAKPVLIEQMQADPLDSGAWSVEARSVPLIIRIKNYANRLALIKQLKGWFVRGSAVTLVVTFNDEAADYQLVMRVVNLVQDPDYPMKFTALLQGVDTAWRSVATETDTWTPTGSGGTKTITVGGDYETRLTAVLTPSVGPASGYLKQALYLLPNQPGVNLGWGPWCLTLDTAALIADNTNKCQINNGAGIDDTQTTIPYDTVTGTLPSAGMGYITAVPTEQISWTGKTGTTSGNLTGVTRGIGGTVANAHADNTEIKLSTIQASCADVRVMVNGNEVNRWVAAPNTSATHLWFNLWLNAGYSLTLLTAVASSGSIAYLEFNNTPNTRNALGKMPKSGVLYHGSEWFLYDGIDPSTRRVTITKRGILGTTLQGHNGGDVFLYIQNVITLTYSNSTVALPELSDDHYDDTKPLFDLSASDNTQWVYTASTQFRDINNTGRTGAWATFEKKNGTVTKLYDITTDADSGNPAMGQKIGAYLKSGAYAADSATLRHVMFRACGIYELSMTGKKFRNGGVFPATAAVQKSKDGKTWVTMWSEGSPAAKNTWTNWGSHANVALGNGYKWVSQSFIGTIGGSALYAMQEALTATVEFETDNLPTGVLLGATDNFQLDLVFTNNANSQALSLLGPMLLGKAVSLDGENFTATYDETNAHDMIRLNDESRTVWIGLQPGSNQLQITATDIGTLGIALSWYKRRL